MTFAVLLEVWWQAKRAALAESTVREYQRIIDTRLTPDLGAIHLDRLLPYHLDRYYAALARDGLRAGSIRQVHAVVRGALGQAYRWGWLPTNTAVAARPPRRTKPDIQPPTPVEMRRLVAGAEDVSATFGLLVRLAAVLGARRGELCGLRWEDIDLDGRTLTIRTGIADVAGRLVETDTKSHRPRTISIDADTARRLRAHHERAVHTAVEHDTALVPRAFVLSEAPDGCTPFRPDKATGTFRRLAHRSGLRAARLHDLRHFAATRMLTAGVDVRTVAGRLGHGQPWTTLNTYAAFVPERDQVAADHLAALLDGTAPTRRLA
jgi:integrase